MSKQTQQTVADWPLWFLLAVGAAACIGCLPPDGPPDGPPGGTAAVGTACFEEDAANVASEPSGETPVEVAADSPQPPSPEEPEGPEEPAAPMEPAPNGEHAGQSPIEPEPVEPEPVEPEPIEREPVEEGRVGEAMRMLASADRSEVLAAQETLFERPQAALPLLQQATRSDDAAVVAGALEMLRRLDSPEKALPIMVDVIARPDRSAHWPDAVREIGLAGASGAGGPLLKLALAADSPEQRSAALDALARVPDPPRETVAALLPLLFTDGPHLEPALIAAARAVSIHGQHDLLSARGLGAELSPESLERLAAIPDRLSHVMADGRDARAALAAKRLAITTRHVSAAPLPDVKVLAFTGQMEDSPAAALLDGVWDTVDPTFLWRYAADRPGSIVLDLGGPRTVVGVRIWNLNEPGGMHRGWKDVAVSAGSTPAELATPLAAGIVPMAPGKADSPDFSTTLPVEFARGRYVRLEARSVWRKDAHAGLSEVQVLGY